MARLTEHSIMGLGASGVMGLGCMSALFFAAEAAESDAARVAFDARAVATQNLAARVSVHADGVAAVAFAALPHCDLLIGKSPLVAASGKQRLVALGTAADAHEHAIGLAAE